MNRSIGYWLILLPIAIACDPLVETEPTERGLRKDRGGTNSDFDYCVGTIACIAGEGDCDSDAQCVAGAFCGTNNGPAFGMPATWDVCVPLHCRSGVQDVDESGVDTGGSCGGGSGPACGGIPGSPTYCFAACPCAAGNGDFDSSADCASGLACAANLGPQFGYASNIDVCVVPHCANRRRDADETFVDCGGADCGACTTLPPGVWDQSSWDNAVWQ